MSGPAERITDWYEQHRGALRAAVRATTAGTLSYVVAALFDLSAPYWAVMSSLLIIQSTLGASLKASLDRLAGTIGGVICGGLVGWLIPWNDPYALLIALAVTLVPLTLLAALDNRYHIAPITAVITLVLPRDMHSGALAFAVERTIEVGVGGIIAVVVAFFVLPSRGHRLLAEAAGDAFRAIAELLPRIAPDAGSSRPDGAALHDVIAALDTRMSALADAATETRREYKLRLSDDPDPEPLLILAKRLRNDAVMLLRAAAKPLPEPLGGRLAPIVDAVITEASAFLQALATAMETGGVLPASDRLRDALSAYRTEIDAIRSAGLFRSLPAPEVERLASLGFALEQLGDDLIALAAQCAHYAQPPAPAAPIPAA